MNNLIDKIFVINLEECFDRKNHIIQLFIKNNISSDNYEFFNGYNKNSNIVNNIINTDFCKKYPDCFRCNKKLCNCDNNIITPNQIGNWCSFIYLMKHIIDSNYANLILICEDDIDFIDNGFNIINHVINENFMKKNNIDFNKPILLRLGSLKSNMHNFDGNLNNIYLTKNKIMANPCFAINKLFAESFINNLNIINHTSDVYIHNILPKIDNQIQDFTLNPQPVYEHSFKCSKFPSTIHPKGFDDKDKIKQKNYIKKIQFDDLFEINGHKMFVPKSTTDGIFISLRNHKIWEKDITEYLLVKFKELKIDTFIDVGANIGYFTLLFANLNCLTYSFEPNEYNFNILNQNIIINKFQNSFIFNHGIGNKDEIIKFYYNNEKSGHGSFNENIKNIQNLHIVNNIHIKKLDDVEIKGKNIMIKIDVEGFEFDVLKGMDLLLKTKRIKCLCLEMSRKFYGVQVENKIINILNKYFEKIYIVEKKIFLEIIPNDEQYNLICFN